MIEKGLLHIGACNSRREAFYDAINLRVSQLISSVTKSRSGHEFSRPCPEIPSTRPRENFCFRFSGLWPYHSRPAKRGDISGKEAIVHLLDDSRDNSHFQERATEFIIRAYLVYASSPYAYLYRRPRNYRFSALYLSDTVGWAECLPEIVT